MSSSPLLTRAAVLVVAGLATVSVAGCGSSDKSGGAASSASTATSVSSAATTSTTSAAPSTSASDGSAASGSSSATDGSSASSGSSSAAAPASGQRFTAAQLDQAMKATTINGTPLTVSDQSMVKESLSGAEKMRAEVHKSMKISPAECQATYASVQAMGDASTSTPTSMGSLDKGKTAVVALQLPANSPDTWDTSKLAACHELTLSGTVLGMSVAGKATLTQVDVPATVASNAHGLREDMTQDGKPMTVTIAMARVGDVEIETMHTSSAASGQQLATELDAVATQIKKLG